MEWLQIHSDLLRKTTLRDLAEIFPERFNNKTNGVTPRRWLLLSNPGLSNLITDAIGDGWITDLGQLSELRAFTEDKGFRGDFLQAKRNAKRQFCDWFRWSTGQILDPDSIFDCQVKRIHEYKRQLLNALRIVVLYNRLRRNPGLRPVSADISLRRQGCPCIPAGQADYQIHQQSGSHHRQRPCSSAGGSRSYSCPSTASRLQNT